MNWWSAWGQSATAIGGVVLGAASLALSIYNARMAREKHGWEKQGRADEQGRERWVQEKVKTLQEMPERADRPRTLQVEDDRHGWAEWAEKRGDLRVFRRGDGKWFLSLPR